MNIQLKETSPKAKSPLFAGIDVGAEELILVIRKNVKPLNPQKFANTHSDHARLVKKLAKLSMILPRSSGHSAKRVISKTEVNNENQTRISSPSRTKKIYRTV